MVGCVCVGCSLYHSSRLLEGSAKMEEEILHDEEVFKLYKYKPSLLFSHLDVHIFCMEVRSHPSTSLSVGSWNKLGHDIISFLLVCCTVANQEVWVMGWAGGHRRRGWGRGRGAWRGWRVVGGEWRGRFWRIGALFSEEPAMPEGGGKQQGLSWERGQEGFGLARRGKRILLVVITEPRGQTAREASSPGAGGQKQLRLGAARWESGEQRRQKERRK